MYTFSCWIICENSSISEIFIFKIAKGATIDRSATFPIAVAKKFNRCVTIDSNVSIGHDVDFTSMLCPMHIGHHAIIGNNVSFILSTHDIDSTYIKTYMTK